MKVITPDTTRTQKSTPTNREGNIPISFDKNPRRHRSPWRLVFYAGGAEHRKWFPTEKEALASWTNHKRLEKRVGSFASNAAPADFIALDRIKRKLPAGAAVDDAIDFYLAHRPQQEAPALGAAVDQFLESKRVGLDRSKVHVKDLKMRLRVFARDFGEDRPLLFFTRNNVLDWLMSLQIEPRTVANYRAALGNFFGYWAARKCLAANPMDEITKAVLPKVKHKRKVILSPAQARAFMACVLADYPQYSEFFALQMLAGMRDSQAERIQGEHLDPIRRRITVPAEICKTGDDWILQDLPPALWDWLAVNKVAKGPIGVPSTRQWTHITAALKGIAQEDGQIAQWPPNGLRRSFCTYDISANDSADKTAAKLQHQSPRRLYRSYLSALRTKEEAAEYLGITPDSVRGLWARLTDKKVVPFTKIA